MKTAFLWVAVLGYSIATLAASRSRYTPAMIEERVEVRREERALTISRDGELLRRFHPERPLGYLQAANYLPQLGLLVVEAHYDEIDPRDFVDEIRLVATAMPRVSAY